MKENISPKNWKWLKLGEVVLVISILASCRAVKSIPENYADRQQKDRKTMLAVFMDGTRDMPHKKIWKNTHVQKFHQLADTANFASLYIEGVGAKKRLRQAANATTTDTRVMRAYRFLAEHYRPGDSICLFGFSRGSNQCRILASFIYTIGIIKLNNIKEEDDKEKLLLGLYDEYISVISVEAKRKKMITYIKEWEQKHPEQPVAYDITGTTPIELLALWDTVEALLIGDRQEDPTPIVVHLNQLYNVKKFYHAVSLDDNRAFNYSPVLATHKSVELHPQQDINAIVEEVWFNGSHKDVGGGVRKKKRDQLSGLSLNWMYHKIKPYHIIRDTNITPNPFGVVNNMRGDPIVRMTSPGDTLRGIDKYWDQMNVNYNQRRIKVHQTVIDRLKKGQVQYFKLRKCCRKRSDWYDWEPFSQCFIKDGDKRIFDEKNCPCIEVVND